MTRCLGTADDHCCYLGKWGVCPHLEEGTVEGRRFACGLVRRYGGWEKAMASPEWVRDVKPFWDEFMPGKTCADWPGPGVTCATCGATG